MNVSGARENAGRGMFFALENVVGSDEDKKGRVAMNRSQIVCPRKTIWLAMMVALFPVSASALDAPISTDAPATLEPVASAVEAEPASEEPTESEPVAPVVQDEPPVSDLQEILAPLLEDPLVQRANVAVHVVNASTGEVVFDHRGSEPLVPASTMKAVTAASALRTLGPAYRFETKILKTGDITGAGVLNGDLYVKGGGDPTMVIEKLWKLVQDIRLNGIREVNGRVVFDDSDFETHAGVPGWNKPEDIERGPSYYPALGGLSLNFNTVALVVGPGANVGDPARVELETPTDVVTIDNAAVTGSTGASRWVRLSRSVEASDVTFKVEGRVPATSKTRRYYRTVPDPTAYFVGAFAAMCESHGIRVRKGFQRGITPAGASTFLTVQSQPLGKILLDMNKFSNNFIAEQVLQAMGTTSPEQKGTTTEGLKVVDAYLASIGVSGGEDALVNGSGLSRHSKIRASTLTSVLVDMYSDPQVGAEFRSSLAIGGLDGTLRKRFDEGDEVNRLRGKTGSLNGVHCLTAYVEAADGEMYAFAFLVNDLSGPLSRAKKLQDRFASALFSVGTPEQIDGSSEVLIPASNAGEVD